MTTSTTVEPQDLRIGMFIHLDGGWMSHPFPLSSFKISNAEQIETIRSLGLKKVRWSPERSDLLPEAPAPVPAPPAAEAEATPVPVEASASTRKPAATCAASTMRSPANPPRHAMERRR